MQFAVNPETREYRVIEVNPRVSRSSALASKATGYSIARVAAKIAIGKTLDEIPNKITGKTFAAFEPTLDYVVMKIPRWPFDKFRTVDKRIGTQMKSTGEVMAIGRTVEESIMKAIRSLEIDKIDLEPEPWSDAELHEELIHPTDKRLFGIAEAFRRGMGVEELANLTKWDAFFLIKIKNLVDMERTLRETDALDLKLLHKAKRMGFPDESIAGMIKVPEKHVRDARKIAGILPTYKMVDTCAAEFEAATPYFYSTYESVCEAKPSSRRKIVIVGAGPIRIGQGIEFDYCCVHGVMACREEGVDAIVINNNPETVSTDFDISDRLYFEPLTLEDVLNVIEREDADGVIVQYGGQTSVNLAVPLEKALEGHKCKILGTSPDMIDMAEDRKRWSMLMRELDIKQPESGTGHSADEVKAVATVSPTLDLEVCITAIERPSNWFYQRDFLVSLKQRVRRKAASYPWHFSAAYLPGVRTIREFDERYTSRLYGFGNAANYYYQASSLRVVRRIRVPTLIITAKDDPFVPASQFDTPAVTGNASIRLVVTPHGGHCGFVARQTDGDGDRYWAERAVVDFVGEFMR